MNPTVSETSMRGFVSGFSARTVVVKRREELVRDQHLEEET
jgi:hypothetical protein